MLPFQLVAYMGLIVAVIVSVTLWQSQASYRKQTNFFMAITLGSLESTFPRIGCPRARLPIKVESAIVRNILHATLILFYISLPPSFFSFLFLFLSCLHYTLVSRSIITLVNTLRLEFYVHASQGNNDTKQTFINFQMTRKNYDQLFRIFSPREVNSIYNLPSVFDFFQTVIR